MRAKKRLTGVWRKPKPKKRVEVPDYPVPPAGMAPNRVKRVTFVPGMRWNKEMVPPVLISGGEIHIVQAVRNVGNRVEVLDVLRLYLYTNKGRPYARFELSAGGADYVGAWLSANPREAIMRAINSAGVFVWKGADLLAGSAAVQDCLLQIFRSCGFRRPNYIRIII